MDYFLIKESIAYCFMEKDKALGGLSGEQLGIFLKVIQSRKKSLTSWLSNQKHCEFQTG